MGALIDGPRESTPAESLRKETSGVEVRVRMEMRCLRLRLGVSPLRRELDKRAVAPRRLMAGT